MGSCHQRLTWNSRTHQGQLSVALASNRSGREDAVLEHTQASNNRQYFTDSYRTRPIRRIYDTLNDWSHWTLTRLVQRRRVWPQVYHTTRGRSLLLHLYAADICVPPTKGELTPCGLRTLRALTAFTHCLLTCPAGAYVFETPPDSS